MQKLKLYLLNTHSYVLCMYEESDLCIIGFIHKILYK